jgi:hypothetical protein
MSCFSFPFIKLYNIIMNKNTKPLKYIFENHFHQTWNNIKHKFPKNLHSSIWNNISKFLDCGDISQGYTAFKCNKCSHIPPEDFKMIRRLGLYSRRCKNKKSKKIKLFKDKISWTERILKTFKTNPLTCPKCNSDLILLEIYSILNMVWYFLKLVLLNTLTQITIHSHQTCGILWYSQLWVFILLYYFYSSGSNFSIFFV